MKFFSLYSFLFPCILSASPKTLKAPEFMGNLNRCVERNLQISSEIKLRCAVLRSRTFYSSLEPVKSQKWHHDTNDTVEQITQISPWLKWHRDTNDTMTSFA